MKKLYTIITIVIMHFATAQINDWDTALSKIYTPTTGFNSHKILLDKVSSFADLYNFNYNEHNTSNASHFRQALSELYRASGQTYFTNYNLFPNYEKIANSSEIPIGIINTQCSYLNYDEENNANGNLKISNGIFQPIDMSIPNFIEKQLTVISPLIHAFVSNDGSFTFKLDSQQIYQYGNAIKQLDVNFGDGVWRNVIANFSIVQSTFTINLNITNPVRQMINFRITQLDNSQLSTNATILLSKKVINPTYARISSCGISDLIKYRSAIADNAGVKGEIEYRVFYGNQNTSCQIKKPIVIVDGFDPGDTRRISLEDCLNDKNCIKNYEKDTSILTLEKYPSITRLMEYSNHSKSLITDMNTENYDVILVNFPF